MSWTTDNTLRASKEDLKEMRPCLLSLPVGGLWEPHPKKMRSWIRDLQMDLWAPLQKFMFSKSVIINNLMLS